MCDKRRVNLQNKQKAQRTTTYTIHTHTHTTHIYTHSHIVAQIPLDEAGIVVRSILTVRLVRRFWPMTINSTKMYLDILHAK